MTRTQHYLFPIVVTDQDFTKLIGDCRRYKQLLDVYLGEYELDKERYFYVHVSDNKYFKDSPYVQNKRFLKTGYVIKWKIPERFYGAYDSFLLGKYSKMYSNNELNELFIHNRTDKGLNWKHMVLTRNKEYIPSFIEQLKKSNLVSNSFNPNQEWLDNTELDIPPKKEDLILL